MRLISRLLSRHRNAEPVRQFHVLEANSPAVDSADCLVEHVGIAIHDDTVAPLLQSGSKAPIEASYTFSTSEDNQDQITLRFYRGRTSPIIENTFLGEIRLSGFPLAKAQEPLVRVFIRFNGGNLELAAINESTGDQVTLARVRTADLQAVQ